MAMTKKEKAYVEFLEQELARFKAIAAISIPMEEPEPMFSDTVTFREYSAKVGKKKIEGYTECLELDELFARVDRIGRKYQDPEEAEAYEQRLYEINKEIEAISKAKK